MKTIIAGTRTVKDYELVRASIELSGFKITEVLCGGAQGVDYLGQCWASQQTPPIKVNWYFANWKAQGKSAGFIRNSLMIEAADALIAVWDGRSHGTRDTINKAREKGLKMYVSIYDEDSPLVPFLGTWYNVKKEKL